MSGWEERRKEGLPSSDLCPPLTHPSQALSVHSAFLRGPWKEVASAREGPCSRNHSPTPMPYTHSVTGADPGWETASHLNKVLPEVESKG